MSRVKRLRLRAMTAPPECETLWKMSDREREAIKRRPGQSWLDRLDGRQVEAHDADAQRSTAQSCAATGGACR